MRVGTRYTVLIAISAVEDHPHACGDKKHALRVEYVSEGSSPCVWGQAF